MIEIPEWIYKQYGGLDDFEAEKRVVDYCHSHGIPIKRPEGYHLKIDMNKQPLRPILIGKEPETLQVMQDITPPMRLSRIIEDGVKPTMVIKIRVWEPFQMGFSCWIESSRDDNTTPKTSLGRWLDFRWYNWRVKE